MRQSKNTAAVAASRVPSVAARNTSSDQTMTGRRPKRSDSGPMTICSTAFSPRYSDTDSCITQ